MHTTNKSVLPQSEIKYHGVNKNVRLLMFICRKENPQKLTQLSSRSHPRHLVGRRTAQKDTIIDITSDSQVNSNFPYRWSPASLTFNKYSCLFWYNFATLVGFATISLHLVPSCCWRGPFLSIYLIATFIYKIFYHLLLL